MRSTWMAQELLSTFEQEIAELSLRPGGSGVFKVTANGKTIWSRSDKARFPDIKELKQRVRDVIVPDQDLGHVDRP